MVSSDGRVTLWRGEGTEEDGVAGRDGTLEGTTAGYRTGVVGQALSIPGDTDWGCHRRLRDPS